MPTFFSTIARRKLLAHNERSAGAQSVAKENSVEKWLHVAVAPIKLGCIFVQFSEFPYDSTAIPQQFYNAMITLCEPNPM